MGLKKLPSVKSLQTEYAEKKAAYTEYREARGGMMRLHIYRANAEQILGIDTREAEKKKEREQR